MDWFKIYPMHNGLFHQFLEVQKLPGLSSSFQYLWHPFYGYLEFGSEDFSSFENNNPDTYPLYSDACAGSANIYMKKMPHKLNPEAKEYIPQSYKIKNSAPASKFSDSFYSSTPNNLSYSSISSSISNYLPSYLSECFSNQIPVNIKSSCLRSTKSSPMSLNCSSDFTYQKNIQSSTMLIRNINLTAMTHSDTSSRCNSISYSDKGNKNINSVHASTGKTQPDMLSSTNTESVVNSNLENQLESNICIKKDNTSTNTLESNSFNMICPFNNISGDLNEGFVPNDECESSSDSESDDEILFIDDKSNLNGGAFLDESFSRSVNIKSDTINLDNQLESSIFLKKDYTSNDSPEKSSFNNCLFNNISGNLNKGFVPNECESSSDSESDDEIVFIDDKSNLNGADFLDESFSRSVNIKSNTASTINHIKSKCKGKNSNAGFSFCVSIFDTNSSDEDDCDSEDDLYDDFFGLEIDGLDSQFLVGGLVVSNFISSSCECKGYRKDPLPCLNCNIKGDTKSRTQDNKFGNINLKWNQNVIKNVKCSTPQKVNFDINTIVILVENCDRAGPWEEHARDRMRFRRRIQESELVLSPMLHPKHREKIYHKICN